MSAAQQRWNAFLAQIEQRHGQVRAEAEQYGAAYTADDLAPLSHHEPAIQIDNLAFEIGSRMEQWYVSSAEFEPAWVQAGRPREPL